MDTDTCLSDAYHNRLDKSILWLLADRTGHNRRRPSLFAIFTLSNLDYIYFTFSFFFCLCIVSFSTPCPCWSGKHSGKNSTWVLIMWHRTCHLRIRNYSALCACALPQDIITDRCYRGTILRVQISDSIRHTSAGFDGTPATDRVVCDRSNSVLCYAVPQKQKQSKSSSSRSKAADRKQQQWYRSSI